ncbi:TPA: hypothetical protein ACOECG_004402 [Stenotrophomonas maltophilia]
MSIVSAGIGAGLVVLVLGVPRLWTAEAAGWASAVATTGAAFVALYVGLLPSRQSAKARQKIADSVLKLLVAEATEQSFYVSCSVAYLSRSDVIGAGFNHARKFAERMDAEPFKEALPYFDALPPEIVELITIAIVTIQRNTRLISATPESAATATLGSETLTMAKSLKKVMDSLDDFRRAAGHIIGQPPKDHPDRVSNLVDAWAAAARTFVDLQVKS